MKSYTAARLVCTFKRNLLAISLFLPETPAGMRTIETTGININIVCLSHP